jgi:CBS domain-containing protein
MGEPELVDDIAAQDEARVQASILSTPISSMQLDAPAVISGDSTLAHAVETLQKRHLGCVLVVDAEGRLSGIFTERDLLNRVAGKRLDWAVCRVADHMTRDPETLRLDDRIAWALNRMHIGGYRNVPLTDDNGKPVGLVSVKDIVGFIVDLFPSTVLNLPPDPRQPGKWDRESASGGEG